MKEISNIIFDLGGVLLNLDNQRTEDAFVSLGVGHFRSLFGHGFAASFIRDYEIGRISDREFIDQLKQAGGLSVSDEVIIEAWNCMLLDFPAQRIELLKELGKRYRLFLFSNTNALHLAALQQIYRNTFGQGSLDDHFEKTYYSHIMGLRKPDRESYQYIITENGLDAGRTLFVDDALVNVDGAIAAGLQGYFLQPGTSINEVDW